MNNKVLKATKWSAISEIIAKLIAPITTIVLARILAQEIFGIVASITAITSLADLLTDAGFNAYIVQHQFEDSDEENKTFNVCFWSNLVISFTLFFVIVFNSKFFSRVVGADGYHWALIVSSFVIPLTSISSISQAIMKKIFEFKKLGLIKISTKCIPFFTTIPLALMGFSYWSIIIGTLVGELINAIICLIFGNFRPKMFYSFKILTKIFKFSGWAFLESILEWLLCNLVILVLANIYGNYYLGIFKTGLTLITQITTSLYALYCNVYKSAMSKFQNNHEEFENTFNSFQKYTTIFSIPVGIGAFFFCDFITFVLLGDEWMEASKLIGLWGLVSMMSIAFGNFFSDGIRAKGYPLILVIVDSIYLAFMVVLLCFARNLDFVTFCSLYCLIKLVQPILQIVFGIFICKIKLINVIKNTTLQLISSGIMSIFIIITFFNKSNYIMQLLGIILSALIYFLVLFIMWPNKKELLNYLKQKK